VRPMVGRGRHAAVGEASLMKLTAAQRYAMQKRRERARIAKALECRAQLRAADAKRLALRELAWKKRGVK
jgi:hypothetical protein